MSSFLFYVLVLHSIGLESLQRFEIIRLKCYCLILSTELIKEKNLPLNLRATEIFKRKGISDCVHTMAAHFENGEKFDG